MTNEEKLEQEREKLRKKFEKNFADPWDIKPMEYTLWLEKRLISLISIYKS